MTEGAQPLLPPDDPGAGDAESAALGVPDAAEAGRPRVSVASLLAVEPGQAIDILEQHGVVTLGSMTVKDAAFKAALGTDDDDLLTAAAPDPQSGPFDWRRFWAARLPAPRADCRGNQKQVWTADVEVLARVVAVEDAAKPGPVGLVNLALSRYQVSGDPSIFTVPAVEAVITYKW
ncbi:hypothetical protein MNEG_15411 [Monoraphidium neglectum]|uniref:Uncharacterized protein n=1 Tax=Monoraphidium neglectum TaxID=145388 RepID=A0A0D2IX65_9CHLO|nr:hypothetical protein MNEG_15411 [Monoraphidium neglectum]KIY92552.1 hypothetical protein MNEG_15411 [Monoraphidium neglectum]|eukprot:XP_013891572.1 hypothetical protein MNEG_15411 [Monoraphidium neglectum]